MGDDMKTLLSFTWMLASVGALYAGEKDQVGDLIKLADKAAAALSKRGEKAVAPLAVQLANKNDEVRAHAVWALGLNAPAARDTTADVVKLLGDKNANVRFRAAFALGRMGSKGQACATA